MVRVSEPKADFEKQPFGRISSRWIRNFQTRRRKIIIFLKSTKKKMNKLAIGTDATHFSSSFISLYRVFMKTIIHSFYKKINKITFKLVENKYRVCIWIAQRDEFFDHVRKLKKLDFEMNIDFAVKQSLAGAAVEFCWSISFRNFVSGKNTFDFI